MRKYLCGYTTIFKKNVRASYFTTINVDAFAGTGLRAESAGRRGKAAVLDDVEVLEAEALQKGSAHSALEVAPPFDRYVFVERRATRARELESRRGEFPGKASAMQTERADANK